MKRILCLALICVLLVSSLAPVAYAEETLWFDLLDYHSANTSDSNKVWYQAGHGVRSVMNIESVYQVEYLDILFWVPDGNPPTGVKFSSGADPSKAISLTMVKIDDHTYRAFGNVSTQTRLFYTWIEGNALTYVVFLSYRVSSTPLSGYDENATCQISAYDYNDTINYRPSDLINYRYFTGANDPLLNSLTLWINCPNWRKYDYLDFIICIDAAGINSVYATLGDTFVPFEINYLDNAGSIENHFLISVRLDLRNLDHSSSEGLFLSIIGQVNSGSENFISMEGCRGFLVNSTIDADMVWSRRMFVWLRDTFYLNVRSILETLLATANRIEALFEQSSASGDAFKEESSELISSLDNISASMDSVQRPSMDAINADFSGDISDGSALMAGLFSAVTQIPWLSTIILASCTLGLISYILFGKD